MKTVVTVTALVEVEHEPGDIEKAMANVQYETDKALDYWFESTDRPMFATSVSVTPQG